MTGSAWCTATCSTATRCGAATGWPRRSTGDCADVGPSGIDPGSLRCDAAWCHGVEAAEHILRGWEVEAGRPASAVPYWDAVAALTPPDMGWFPISMAAQGRPDLTREVMLERRDTFLDAALSRLTATWCSARVSAEAARAAEPARAPGARSRNDEPRALYDRPRHGSRVPIADLAEAAPIGVLRRSPT